MGRLFSSARKAYGYLLPVPVVGTTLRNMVRLGRLAGRMIARPVTSRIEEMLSLHANAISGVRDAHHAFRVEVGTLIEGIESKLEMINSAIAALRAADVGISSQLRTNSADTSRKLQQIDSAIDNLQATNASFERKHHDLNYRIEFVRQEIMFELRRLTSKSMFSPNNTNSRVVNIAKLEEQMRAGKVRLNVGCGHVIYPEYINVDARELPGVDVVAEASKIPLAEGSVVELLSLHLLEHFSLEDLRRTVLPHWASLLKSGGMMRAIVPDAEAMLAAYANNEMSFEDLREVTFGLQEYEGDFHFTMFSRDSLKKLIQSQGFIGVEYSVVGRRNGKCFEMEIEARKV